MPKCLDPTIIDQIVVLGNKRIPYSDISMVLDIDPRVVKKYLKVNNIAPELKISTVDSTLVSIIKDYHNKFMSTREISHYTGLCQTTVLKYLNHLGLHPHNSKKLKVKNNEGLCTICDMWKDIDAFPKNSTYCKLCKKEKRLNSINNNIEEFIKARFKSLKGRCKLKGISLDITAYDLYSRYKLQKGKCFYTDQKLICTFGNGTLNNTLSIDRIVPEIGYTLTNVVLCTFQVNTCKSNVSLEQMKMWMPEWYNRSINFIGVRNNG